VSSALEQEKERLGSRVARRLVADNDDELPDEIIRVIDAMARAAARRDHHAAMKETAGRD
jgi:hypothetical protein